ncbi:hypothetical protein [Nitrosophilus kaiyonis]|uniref:hypothetical protein n=1 Tax=Nitrosophilus kaiyonis TaxID=2930200 RepID=UPI0024937367|nr:hypothetical protein [Nitrosophilus kaiyonis]
MADMKNIELFDIYVGYIFNKLYDDFPVCKDFDTTKCVKEINGATANIDTKRKEYVFSETLFWLKENGIIEIEKPHQRTITIGTGLEPFPYFTCVRLTAKGLAILKKVPDSISDKKTIGEEITEAVKNGFKERVTDMVKLALEYIVS